jgi:hypothetical protein
MTCERVISGGQLRDLHRGAEQRARCADSGLSPRWVVTPIADLRRYEHIGSDVPSADNRIRAKGQVTIAAIHAASLTAAPMAEPVLSSVLRIVTP